MKSNQASDCRACHEAGEHLREVADDWLTFINHCRAVLNQLPIVTPPVLTDTTCFNCQKDTQGDLHSEPQRFWVICKDCLLVKYEARP